MTAAPWTSSKPIDVVMSHTLILEDAIATCYGYVFDKKGRLIVGATHKLRETRKYPPWISRGPLIRPHPLFPKIMHYKAVVAVLTASTQRFYFHWLFDVLPRFGMLAQSGETPDLVYLQQNSRFQQESLELLGISGNQIINTDDVAVLTSRKLVVPCHQIMKGREIPSWVIEFLRANFLPKAGQTSISENRRIYISRRSADRRVKNEKQIIANLSRYGFSSFDLEKLSLRDQIRLFRDVQVIVSPHGSGLANIVFSSPGTTVIELFPAANVDLFYRLSRALNLDYFYVKSRHGNPDKVPRHDYDIEWEDLERTLDAADITPLPLV